MILTAVRQHKTLKYYNLTLTFKIGIKLQNKSTRFHHIDVDRANQLNKYTLSSVYLYYYIITFTMLEKKIGNTFYEAHIYNSL